MVKLIGLPVSVNEASSELFVMVLPCALLATPPLVLVAL
jgi:hypothetical protein